MNNRYVDYVLVAVALGLLFFYLPFELTKNEAKSQEEKFLSYIRQFNKSYIQGTDEYGKRLIIFKASLARAEQLNAAGNADAEYGLSKFSDLSAFEFRSRHLRPRRLQAMTAAGSPLRLLTAPRGAKSLLKLPAGLPPRVDWRDRHVVTPVRDQGDCGACWAFSTVEVLESMYALKTGNLTQLSVQQVIDCSSNNLGCTGGDVCWALDWLQGHRIVPESRYPLTLRDDACRLQSAPGGVRASTTACEMLVGREEKMLRLLATQGPVAVGADATSWQDYISGVIRFNCESELNHAVQLVGYDWTGDVPYYIVRNSWGGDFGLNGYLHVAVGSDLCGLSQEVGSITV